MLIFPQSFEKLAASDTDKWNITGMFHPTPFWFQFWSADQLPNFQDSLPL